MKNKIILLGLLGTIILGSCAPTSTALPSIVPPTPTFTAIPIPTIFVTPPQAPHTKDGLFIEPYQDVRFQDLSSISKSLGESLIKTLWFDQPTTIWSKEDEQVAENILQLGMDPGLGVRELHAEGITGKGVTVAIIDQNMVLDHPEFQGKIVKYYDVGTNKPPDTVTMHGPAVTSLLVGKNIGTAPDASIYYVAAPSWLYDAQYYADALDWVIEQNTKLSDDNKIRVVSVSAIPSGMWSEYTNQDAWDAAYKRARDAGILVLDCTYEQGITVPCTYDLHDPDNVAKCIPNWKGPINPPHQRINIPTSRTSATEENGFSYQFTGDGGLSWSVPYLAGILAMGWQINPNLTGDQLLKMVFASAYKTNGPADIINPQAFIEMVRDTIK